LALANLVMLFLISRFSAQSTLLSRPFDIDLLADALQQTHTGFRDMSGDSVKKQVATMGTLRDAGISNREFDCYSIVTSWTDLPTGDIASLDFNLGARAFSRKTGTTHFASGCVVLPVKRE
jgi:hypothetical protein